MVDWDCSLELLPRLLKELGLAGQVQLVGARELRNPRHQPSQALVSVLLIGRLHRKIVRSGISTNTIFALLLIDEALAPF